MEKLLMDNLNLIKKSIQEDEDENYPHKDLQIEAIELFSRILEKRLSNTLKQYNNDKGRAWDDYSIRNILNQMNLYIEEFYLADKPDSSEYILIRKYLRQYLLSSWEFFNK